MSFYFQLSFVEKTFGTHFLFDPEIEVLNQDLQEIRVMKKIKKWILWDKSSQPTYGEETIQFLTELDSCCEDQYDKKKYPFLKTPDYAFENDHLDRINYFNNKFCKTKPNQLNLSCENIIL
jgi:hypothetical protein